MWKTGTTALALALAAGAVAPQSAAAEDASFVYIGSELWGGIMSFSAFGATANRVTVSHLEPMIVITDAGGAVVSPDCLELTFNRVGCPVRAVKRVAVGLADGADSFESSVWLRVGGTFSAPRYLAVDVAGHDGDDAIAGGPGDDTLDGGRGNDRISDLTGKDQVNGGDGNDWIHDGAPDWALYHDQGDRLAGGPGLDTVDFSSEVSGVTVTVNGLADDGTPGENDNVMTDVEQLLGSRHDDTLQGFGGPDRLAGNRGNDRLYGLHGADRLDGGAGKDVIHADEGADVVYARDGERDSIHCGGGSDRVFADLEDAVDRDCETVER
jgi:hypothetical protein